MNQQFDQEQYGQRSFKVICTECSEEHSIEEITVENVEEDIQGRDVCFFSCPITKQVAKSFVYGG